MGGAEGGKRENEVGRNFSGGDKTEIKRSQERWRAKCMAAAVPKGVAGRGLFLEIKEMFYLIGLEIK